MDQDFKFLVRFALLAVSQCVEITQPGDRPSNSRVAANAKTLSRGPDSSSEFLIARKPRVRRAVQRNLQLENARAALDLYRSDAEAWESSITQNNWPCALPPSTFSRCYH